ncbi:MAG: c-type cytochrome [Lautropia sp.]|nr:c-type cytochrome [Lautropia sp.]
MLAAGCANCHGPEGHPTASIPPLEGLPAERLRERLRAFRQGAQGVAATVMPRLMKGYDDRQIEALVRWFGSDGDSEHDPAAASKQDEADRDDTDTAAPGLHVSAPDTGFRAGMHRDASSRPVADRSMEGGAR